MNIEFHLLRCVCLYVFTSINTIVNYERIYIQINIINKLLRLGKFLTSSYPYVWNSSVAMLYFERTLTFIQTCTKSRSEPIWIIQRQNAVACFKWYSSSPNNKLHSLYCFVVIFQSKMLRRVSSNNKSLIQSFIYELSIILRFYNLWLKSYLVLYWDWNTFFFQGRIYKNGRMGR